MNTSRWLEKLGRKGHWRKLDPNSVGHDQSDNEIKGRTWVDHKSLLKADVKPFAHQKAWLKQTQSLPKGEGAVAAHGTGTGKTVSAIMQFEQLKESGQAKRVLVLMPAGLRDNFGAKGVGRFTNSKYAVVSHPGRQPVGEDVEYVIASYAAFRERPQEFIDTYKPDIVFADEFQRVANEDSKTNKAFWKVRDQIPLGLFGLTASIASNSPADMAPLVQLVKGNRDGFHDRGGFQRAHLEKQETGKRNIFGGPLKETRLVRTQELRKRLGGSVHYVEDLDASEKPTKEVTSVKVPMSPLQRKLYDMSMEGVDPIVVAKIRAGEAVSQKDAMRILTRLLRARQLSNSLHTVTAMTPSEAAQKTPKIKKMMDDVKAHIKDKDDAQIIIYTNLVRGGVDVITAGLEDAGVPYGIFAGTGRLGVTKETRQQAVDDYLAGKNKVIVITGAGAEGLSLGNTTMVLLADGHYNPERIAQAEARGVRAGGLSHRDPENRKVQVRRYVSSLPKTFWQKLTLQPADTSVDEWVYQTAERKARANRQLRDTLQGAPAQRQSLFPWGSLPSR